MRRTKYAVRLSEAERAQLRTLVGYGVAPARRLTHARILLKADQGEGEAAWADAAIAGAAEHGRDRILQRQCLDRRLGDRATVEREVAAWARERNAAARTVDWRFTTADARIKLKRLYPAHDD